MGAAQEHRAQLGVDLRKRVQNVQLLAPLSATALQINQVPGATRLLAVDFSPSIADTVGLFHFTAGFRMIPVFRQSPGTMVPAKLYARPNLQATVPLVKNVINIYGGFVGSVNTAGWSGLLGQNPWISELTEYRESAETRLYAGFNGRITGRLGYQLGMSLISKTNAAQFYRNASGFAADSGRIHVEYVNWTNVQQRAELSYQHPIGLELRSFLELNRYRGDGGTVGTVYHLPSYESGVHGLLNLKGKVRLETDVRWVGPRDVPGTGSAAEVLPSYVDWRMGVYYQYNKQLQAYANGTNLLNSKYALWQGYTVQGIRGVLGLAYKF